MQWLHFWINSFHLSSFVIHECLFVLNSFVDDCRLVNKTDIIMCAHNLFYANNAHNEQSPMRMWFITGCEAVMMMKRVGKHTVRVRSLIVRRWSFGTIVRDSRCPSIEMQWLRNSNTKSKSLEWPFILFAAWHGTPYIYTRMLPDDIILS